MSRVQQIQYKEKNIYCMDFSNVATAAEIRNIINESITFIRSQPPSSVLALSNVTGMRFTQEIKDMFNAFIDGNKPYIKCSAVFGLNGLQIILNGILKVTNRHINSFNSEKEAKDWLVSNS
jgi:hypothetical protein